MVKHTQKKLSKNKLKTKKKQQGGNDSNTSKIPNQNEECTIRRNENQTTSQLSRFLMKWSKSFKKNTNKNVILDSIKNLWITIYTCFSINQSNKNYIINIIHQYTNLDVLELDNLFSNTIKLQELQNNIQNNETKVDQTAIIDYIKKGTGNLSEQTKHLLNEIIKNFDEELKDASLKIYNYNKEKHQTTVNFNNIQPVMGVAHSNSSQGHTTTSTNTLMIPSQITSINQPPPLPIKPIFCNHLKSYIDDKSNNFFEILTNFNSNTIITLPTQETQQTIQTNFLEIFTKACDKISKAKSLKQQLQTTYNDLDIDKLYTLYHIYIVDHLQWSNKRIYSNDNTITQRYNSSSSNNINTNTNINIRRSLNNNYENLVKQTIKEYSKLKDKDFKNFKIYLATNH